jgi:hypothetical protein
MLSRVIGRVERTEIEVKFNPHCSNIPDLGTAALVDQLRIWEIYGLVIDRRRKLRESLGISKTLCPTFGGDVERS